jgi:hypothetical protein
MVEVTAGEVLFRVRAAVKRNARPRGRDGRAFETLQFGGLSVIGGNNSDFLSPKIARLGRPAFPLRGTSE